MAAKGMIKRAGRFALIVIAALWVFGEEWIWNNFTALVARLARLRAVRRAEAVIARQHPYLLLCLFALPALVMLPFKLYAFYLLGTGHAYQGVAVLVVAKALGTALLTRLFVISRDKLLGIRAFAALYQWIMAKKQWLRDELAKVAWLARLGQTARQIKQRLKEGLAALRRPSPGGVMERLGAFRAFLKRRAQAGK